MSEPNAEFLNKARPLAKGLIDYALAAGAPYGISDAEVHMSVSESLENDIENGAVSKSVSGMACSIHVTLYAGDRSVSFSKNTFDEKTLKEAMLQNMKIIHLLPENKDQRLLEKEKLHKGAVPDLDLYDKNPPSKEELIAYAKKMEAAALAEDGIKTTSATSVSKTTSHYLGMASNGLDISENKTSYSAYTSAVAEDKGEMQSDYGYSTSRHFCDMSAPETIGREAAQKTLSLLGAILPDTGKMPIILSPEAAATFFSSVQSAIAGTKIYTGTSFMKDKIGQQVMSKGITLVDDPAVKKGLASGSVDGAGMKSDKITFIEDGVLKSYNAGVYESRKLGMEPIGREGGMTNIIILPGGKTPEELMSDIKDGIYIKGFNGGTADVNSGAHSREAYGTLIKNGKVTDIAVSGFVVSGNLKEMFMNVAVANDTPSLPNTKGSMAVPTTRIDGVMIAGK